MATGGGRPAQLEKIGKNLIQNFSTKEVCYCVMRQLSNLAVPTVCSCRKLMGRERRGHYVHATVWMTVVSQGGCGDQPPQAPAG